MSRSGLLAVFALLVAGCSSDSADGALTSTSGSSASTTTLASTTTSIAATTTAATCDAPAIAGSAGQTVVSQNALGVVALRTTSDPAFGNRIQLQAQFADGRRSQPVTVETSTVMAVADISGDGRLAIFVSDNGNTASSGRLVMLDGCTLHTVIDGPFPFTYIYGGTGLSCGPACFPSVACVRNGANVDVVVRNADRAMAVPGDTNPPPLTDDLLYTWTEARYRLDGTTMVRTSNQSGTSRYGDLPVPKHQGFDCSTALAPDPRPTIAPNPNAPAVEPPANLVACTAEDLELAPSPRLGFLRFFNRSGRTCALAGYPALFGRSSAGVWEPIETTHILEAVTNGPRWTGAFSKGLVAVLSIRDGATPGCVPGRSVTQYDALRLQLPNSKTTIDVPVPIDVASCPWLITPFSADSQDL